MTACATPAIWVTLVIAGALLAGAAFCFGRAWESVSRVQRCGHLPDCKDVR